MGNKNVLDNDFENSEMELLYPLNAINGKIKHFIEVRRKQWEIKEHALL